MLSLAEEQELVEQAREGDEEAFEELILAFTPPLYRVVQRLASDPQEAEATIQEAFWRAWRSLGRYQNDRPFFPYLVTVALNVQRDRWRSERRIDGRELEEIAGEVLDEVSAPESQVEEAERAELLAEGIRRLPGPYRAVIALRYEAEMSYEEMSAALNLPINTIRTHLRRAKIVLKQWLEENNG